MADFVRLSCPSCGSKLQITEDVEQFVCSFCGTEQIVKRRGGIVALAPVIEGLKKVQQGTDKTASELALVRLPEEIRSLETQIHEAISTMMYDKEAAEIMKENTFSAGYRAAKENAYREINIEIHAFLIQIGKRQRVSNGWTSLIPKGEVALQDLKRVLLSLGSQDFQDMEIHVRNVVLGKKGKERKACELILGALVPINALFQLLSTKNAELERHRKIVSQKDFRE